MKKIASVVLAAVVISLGLLKLMTIPSAASTVLGLIPVGLGGCGTSLKTTGGAHYVMRQISAGGVCQVVPLAGLASLAAATGNIANTETVVASYTMPANTFTAPSVIVINVAGTCTTGLTPGLATFRARIGPTTLTGTAIGIGSPTLLASVSNKHFSFDAYLPLRTIVSTTATIDAAVTIFADPLLIATPPVFGGSAGATFDPTVQNLVEFTYQSGASTSSCAFFSVLMSQAML